MTTLVYGFPQSPDFSYFFAPGVALWVKTPAGWVRPGLFQEVFELEPLGEPVDPVVGRDIVLAHAEAVAALGVHMQLGRFVGIDPLLIERDAVGSQPEIIVGGRRYKDRRGVVRNGRFLENGCRGINRRDERWPTLWGVVQRRSCCDGSSSGKADDADMIGVHAVFHRVLLHVDHRRTPVGNR